MYAKDVVSFARSKGWYRGKDADFSWKMAYAKHDFWGVVSAMLVLGLF